MAVSTAQGRMAPFVLDFFVSGSEDQVDDLADGPVPPGGQLLVELAGGPADLEGDLEPAELLPVAPRANLGSEDAEAAGVTTSTDDSAGPPALPSLVPSGEDTDLAAASGCSTATTRPRTSCLAQDSLQHLRGKSLHQR